MLTYKKDSKKNGKTKQNKERDVKTRKNEKDEYKKLDK